VFHERWGCYCSAGTGSRQGGNPLRFWSTGNSPVLRTVSLGASRDSRGASRFGNLHLEDSQMARMAPISTGAKAGAGVLPGGAEMVLWTNAPPWI